MIWEDIVIAVVVLVFTLTTVPMIRAKVKLPLWTTAPMVVGALALIVAYVSLELWFSVAIEAVAVILWAWLLRNSLTNLQYE